MTRNQLITAFEKLGHFLRNPDTQADAIIQSAQYENGWFTPEQTRRAFDGIAQMLVKEDLEKWLSTHVYPTTASKQIGLVLAGNIPLVGFHDILCVLSAGHTALIKLSSGDTKLIPFILHKLAELEPVFKDKFIFTDRLVNFDAVIATGSTNTSRYFEYYFRKVPHIIRKNRNSIAILSGKETSKELELLGHDIFDYFGLGCRNVSKLYVPENYSFNTFFEAIESFKKAGDHHKYNNNYDYNKSVYLVNMLKHLDNGFLLLKEDSAMASPLAVIFYEEYRDIKKLQSELKGCEEQIQCIVTEIPIDLKAQKVSFGQSQQPRLWDYADGIDTLKFLKELS